MGLEQTRQSVRRSLGLEIYPALLGDGSGIVNDRTGFVRVRYTSSIGRGMKNVVLMGAYTGPMKPGTPVIVGYQGGELCLLRPDVRGQLVAGADPVLNNPGAQVKSDAENPFVFVPFTSHPTSPASLSVVVRPWVYNDQGTVTHYAGEQVDLSGSQPASGMQCLIGLFMKRDHTLETLASTAKASTEAFGIADIQEIVSAASAGSIEGWLWRLTGDATALTDADKLMDFRPFLTPPARYPYTPTDSTDTYGQTGDEAYDNDYLYLKTAAGWARAALTAF